eukprot:768673-Hanusia_phi.AAC.1
MRRPRIATAVLVPISLPCLCLYDFDPGDWVRVGMRLSFTSYGRHVGQGTEARRAGEGEERRAEQRQERNAEIICSLEVGRQAGGKADASQKSTMREVREEKGEEKQNLTRWDNVETLKMKNVPAKKRKGPTLHHIVFLAIVLFSVFSIVVQSSLSIYKHRMDNGKAISLIPTAQKELGPCHAEVGVEMTRRTALETLEEAAGEECITSEKWKFVFVATNSVISRAVSTFLHASLCVTNSPCDLKASSCQGIWKNRRDFFYFSFVSSPFFFSHLSWSSSAPSGVSFAQWLEGKVALGNQSLLQSSLILSKANCTRVDFIGRLEDMEVHGPKLLLRIRSASANASLSVTEQEMQQGINASSNVSLELLPQLISCRLATRQLSHQQLQTLTALYSRDFEVLGYDKDDAKYVDRVKHTCFKEIERSCALTACSQGDSPATAYAGILRPTTSRDRLRGPRFDFIPQVGRREGEQATGK